MVQALHTVVLLGSLLGFVSANTVINLRSPAVDTLSLENFDIIRDAEDPTAEKLEPGQLLLSLEAVSVDPYMRGRFRPGGVANYFVPPFEVGKPIGSGALAKVLDSKHYNFQKGDYVTGFLPWVQLQVQDPDHAGLYKAPPVEDPTKYYQFLFPLNIAPLSAWIPIREFWPEATINRNGTAYVSGAAGAVGSVAGQILKNVYGIKKVIGSAGSDEKVDWLTDTLGFDAAFNYKKESPYDALPKLAPEGIDYYFDNVGGTTLDAVLLNSAKKGKIISCGSIELYDKEDTTAKMKNLFQITVQQLTIQGYLITEFTHLYEAGNNELLEWIKDDTIKTKETIVEGLENAPEALLGLFQGTNIGKMIVQTSLPEDAVPSLKEEL